MVLAYITFFLGLLVTTGATQHPIPCEAVPVNGTTHVHPSDVARRTYTCISDDYELVGVSEARCNPFTNTLDIHRLPSCVERLPRTTYVTQTHTLLENCGRTVLQDLEKRVLGHIAELVCTMGKCDFKSLHSSCIDMSQAELQSIFEVSNQAARDEVDYHMTWRHRRQKRSAFDDLTPDDSDTQDCPDGQGLTSDGEGCVHCIAGFYSFNSTCTECALGTFQNSTENTFCYNCTDSKTTLYTASDDEDNCVVACPIPSTSTNSAFTVDNVAIADGSSVATGTTVTLACDSGYTYQSASSYEESCASGSTTLKNACYAVSLETSAANNTEFLEVGGSSIFTCKVETTSNPDSFSTGTTNSGSSNGAASTSGSQGFTDDVASQVFSFTSSAGGSSVVTCKVTIYSGETAETSSDTLTFNFFSGEVADESASVGDSVTLTAKVTYSSSATVDFHWTDPDSSAITTNIDDTEDSSYFYSKLSISSASSSSNGSYSVRMEVKDLTSNSKLNITQSGVLTVSGFTTNPSTSSGSDSVTLGSGSELNVTCSYLYSGDTAPEVVWSTTDSGTGDIDGTTGLTMLDEDESDNTVTRVMTIDSDATSSQDGQYYCKTIVEGSFGMASQAFNLTISSKSVTVTSEKCVEAGNDVSLTCTASYPDSLSTAPTIAWYYANSSNLLTDGSDYVTSASKSGTTQVSVLLIKDSTAADATDNYFCKAAYIDPNYFEVESGMSTLSVIGFTSMAEQFALVGTEGISFSTTFSGTVPSAQAWQYNGNDIGSPYSTNAIASATSDGASYSITLPTLATDTIYEFQAWAMLSSPCSTDVSSGYTTTATINILSLNLTTSATQISGSDYYVWSGDSFTLTCKFSNPSSLSSDPTISWSAVNESSADISVSPDTSASAISPSGTETVEIGTASSDYSGTYNCSSSYPDSIGSVEESLDIKVLGVEPTESTYVVEGSDTTISCIFFGLTGSVEWTRDGSSVSGNSESVSGTTTTSSLPLTTVDDGDDGEYSCTMTFTGVSTTKSSQIRVNVLTVNNTITSGTIDAGSSTTLSCVVPFQSSLPFSTNVTWTKNVSGTVTTISSWADSFETTIKSASASDMGVYKCTVGFSSYGSRTAAEGSTLYVRSGPSITVTGSDVNGTYATYNTTVTLSCAISGDEIDDAETKWYLDANPIVSADNFTISSTVESDYGAISVLTIAEADDDMMFTCSMQYDADDATKTATVQMYVMGVTDMSPSSRTINKGGDFNFTCNYENPSSLEVTDVVWLFNGTDGGCSETDGDTAATTTCTNVDVTLNGDVSCEVTFENNLVSTGQGLLWVRNATWDVVTSSYGQLDLVEGKTYTATLMVYGDALSSGYPRWTLDGTRLTSTTENITITETTPSTGLLVSVLELSYVPNDWNDTEFKVAIQYDADSAASELSTTVSIADIALTGETILEVGDDLSLTCTIASVSGNTTWLIDGVEQEGDGETLEIDSVLTTDTAEYTCRIELTTGTYEDSIDVVVNGITGVEQTGVIGNNTDVGETITIKMNATISDDSDIPTVTKGSSTSVSFSNSPSWTQDGDGYKYTITLEWTATASSEADNTDTYTIAFESDDFNLTSSLDITVLEKCTLPSSSSVTGLDGQTIVSGTTVTMSCSSGLLSGGSKATCTDGVTTYSAVNTQPYCVDLMFAESPESSAVEYGEDVTLSCSSNEISVTLEAITWYNTDGTMMKNDTAMTTSGSTVFSSSLVISGTLANHDTSYYCQFLLDNRQTLMSDNGTVYLTGFISTAAHYPGTYFESDAVAGAYSESAYILAYFGQGEDEFNLTVTYTKSSDGTTQTLTMSDTSSSNDTVAVYNATIPETMKYTGTYSFELAYTSADVGNDSYTTSFTLAVYEFCKSSSLPSVDNGEWLPAQKTHFLEYATLTCSTNYFAVGSSTARCLAGGEFDADTSVTCESSSDMTCGDLTSISNGDVVYKNSSAAYYSCDAGYYLVDSEDMYTCDTSTGDWSLVSSSNPDGSTPSCTEAADANSRNASVSMPLAGITGCSSQSSALSTALQTALEDEGLLTCTTSLFCTFGSFSCSGSTASFVLTQTEEMDDPSILSDDTDNMEDGRSVTFSITTSKKRATTTITTGSATVTTTTSCPSGYVLSDGYCYQCPAGYESNSDATECVACSLGHYSLGSGASCTSCSGSKTTMSTGSDSASDCIDASQVCTVATLSANSVYSPPSGSRVSPSTFITITCDSGYSVSYGSAAAVPCSTGSYPECKKTCSLSKYTQTYLDDLNIHSNIELDYLKHDQPLTVTCMSGFEVTEDVPEAVYTCNNGYLEDFVACNEEDSAVLTTVIICVIVLGIAVILLFLFIVVQWKKKKDASYKVNGPRKMFVGPIENPVAMEEGGVKMTKVSLKLQESEKKAPLMSRPVHISDFSKYYDLLTRNDDKELKQEFTTFDSFDDNNTCYNGSIPENDAKNRYKNIIPFDHSRVKLTMNVNDPYSDYINASFIHGYHKPRAFIATQAPKYETADDYWRMIWEQKSTMITNLTKIEENGKLKSIVYWPGAGERSKQYGDIVVCRINEQETDCFTIYTFEIRSTQEEGLREVFMFNYTGWPDFDVPKRTVEFVSFIYNVRHVDSIRPKMGPMVCHCSAGTGRTGAFVGIWNSLDRLCNKDDLDILGMVGALRQQRRKMVFTVSQYKFLHKVMLDILNSENYEELKRGKFRKPLEIREVTENRYATSTSESDDDNFNDTNV